MREKMLYKVIFLCLLPCVCTESCDVDSRFEQLREQLERYDTRIEDLEKELRFQQDKNQKQDNKIKIQEDDIQIQRDVIERIRNTMTMSSEAQEVTPNRKTIPNTKSYYTSFGCLADELTLSCPDGRTIVVTSADYGQYSQTCDTECCPPHPYDCTELMSDSNTDEWLLLKLACDNQTSCTYLYQGSTFVENCSPESTASYVAVYYSCLPEALTEPVGFSAFVDGDNFPEANDLIMFNDVESNFGNYFNAQSSTFLCSQDGIYIFLVSIFPAGHREVFGWVMKDNANLAQFRGDDDLDFANRHGVSNSVITECFRGDKVWVRCTTNNSKISTDPRTSSFSGYLLHKYY